MLCFWITNAMTATHLDIQISRLNTYKKSIQEKEDFLKDLGRFNCKGIALNLGESYPYLPEIRQLFLIRGLLFEEKTSDDLVFDQSLQEAVKIFQKRNILPITGVFDEKTCKKLTKPLKNEIEIIDRNIERLSTLREKIKAHKKVVVINIPQYEMNCIKDNSVDQTIKVIVGSSRRETPLIQDNISTILINPSWTIPEMILVKDKIKIFSRDPSYIKDHHYSITDAYGNELDPYAINWEYVKKNPSFYKFRQSPGRHNALGLFKFVLNNKNNIHIHGTSQQSLFSKENRSLSSGCIRVADPVSFASWLLSEQAPKICKHEKNDENCLAKTLKEKTKKQHTQSLVLERSIPVIFSYITMWVDQSGDIHTNDPYHKDIEKNQET